MPRGKYKRKKKPYHKKDWLYDQYIIKNKSVDDIANKFSVRRATINKYLYKYKIPLKRKIFYDKKYTKHDIEDMIEMKKKGCINKIIGEKYGLTAHTIGNILIEHMEEYNKYKIHPGTQKGYKQKIKKKQKKKDTYTYIYKCPFDHVNKPPDRDVWSIDGELIYPCYTCLCYYSRPNIGML